MYGDDREVPAVLQGLAVLLSLGSAVLLGWWTVIAFIGGTMPILGWETQGGLGYGLLWLVVIDPIAMTVLYWVYMAVLMPLFLVVTGIRHLRSKASGQRGWTGE